MNGHRHIYCLVVDCREEDGDVLDQIVALAQGLRGELVIATGEFVGRRPGVTDAWVHTIVPRSDEQDTERARVAILLEVDRDG